MDDDVAVRWHEVGAMIKSPVTDMLPDHEEFQRYRFETFRFFSIKLGFLVAILSLLVHFPDWIIDPNAANKWIIIKIVSGILLLLFPIAIIRGINRHTLPWILYSSVLLSMILRLYYDSKINEQSLGGIWTIFYYFMCPWILGLPFSRKENTIGILTLLLTPNIIAAFYHDYLNTAIKINIMVIPLVIFLFYTQFYIDILIKNLFEYQNRLNAMANRDALTGLFNRRHFFDAAILQIKRAKRSKAALSLMIADIDHFKSVNDKFGHMIGDLVIKETAKILTMTLRETDLIARLGGEEFVALLVDSDNIAATNAADRVRIAIENTEIHLEGMTDRIRFTASFGVTAIHSDGETLEDIIDRADQGLYAAKRLGRNRVVYQEK